MDATAIGATNSAQRQGPNRGLESLKSEDFFRIMISELKQQNPLEPTETADMISQVSQIRSIEQSNRLNTTLDKLVTQQDIGGLGALIGSYVSAEVTGENGSTQAIEGVVTGVRFESDGTAMLELDTGQAVRASDVQRVTTLDQVQRELQASANAPAASEPGKAGAAQRWREGGGGGWPTLGGLLGI